MQKEEHSKRKFDKTLALTHLPMGSNDIWRITPHKLQHRADSYVGEGGPTVTSGGRGFTRLTWVFE
jgi:hypothetical protein